MNEREVCAQLRSVQELYNALSPDDQAKVNALIDRLWLAARSERQPSHDPPQTIHNTED